MGENMGLCVNVRKVGRLMIEYKRVILKGAEYQKKWTEEATVVVVNFNNLLRRSL
jgi:hypothetical protein